MSASKKKKAKKVHKNSESKKANIENINNSSKNTQSTNNSTKEKKDTIKEKELTNTNENDKESEIIKDTNKLEESKETTESTKNKLRKEESKNNSEKEDNKQIENNSKNVSDKEKSENLQLVCQKKANENDKPDYVQEMIKNKKKRMYISIFFILIIVLMILFSTSFAILNINNTNIIKGVFVKNVDVYGLTKEQAKNKISDAVNIELMAELNLRYSDDYQITLKPEQIEFKYNIEEAIEKAYKIGREGSILENNYSLLLTAFWGNNIDLNYTYNEELLDKFIDDINSKLPGLVVQPSYYIEDNKLIINQGTAGIQIRRENLKKKIIKEISSRKLSDIKNSNFKQVIEIPVENVKANPIDIEKIYAEVHTEPKDAYFETEPYKIYADVDGIDLAISLEEAKSVIEKEAKEEYSFDLKITKAGKTISDLGTEAFPYLVSSFSTKYDASNRNRSTNLKIAADKINGTVLMPGEEFSYNKVVGKRTVEEGYKDAKIYADGGVVDGLAGGICQISSTLYNAVLLANLEITERKNHSFTTSYVAAGRDATVVYGRIDFRFVNSRSYPIKIEASVNNGIAEFKIHGMQEETEYEVKILPVTTKSIPYSTQHVQDNSLAPGQQVISQAGHAGYKVTTYKELRLNGMVVSKEILSNDTYSPMKAVVRVGPGVPIQ